MIHLKDEIQTESETEKIKEKEAKTVYIVPKIRNSEEIKVVKKFGERKYEIIDTKTGVVFPLEGRDAKESLLFKKKVYRNAAGESKTVFSRETGSRLVLLEPIKFIDFKFKAQLEKNDIIDFFESILLIILRCSARKPPNPRYL